ncbi:MAG: FAD-dependent oxidoreductase [Pseudomonadota bacterium]
MTDHCVIVGGSHAAAQLVPSLRQSGWEGAITLVSDDAHLPYHRPPLSKAYLAGETSLEKLLIRPSTFYEKHAVDVRLNTRAQEIDRSARQVLLANGETLRYTKLALAVGATARPLPVPGNTLDGVFCVRDLSDADQIRPLIREGGTAVIIGAGYIGLEVAASLRKLGMAVTVLEAMPRVLQRVTCDEVSAFYQNMHEEEGVRVCLEAAVSRLTGTTSVDGVEFADGTRFAADLVIVGIGVVPRVELAEHAGLEVNNGIVVDEYAQTNDPDIVAVGDCTYHSNGLYESRVRLESVQNATDQAKIAAATVCGKKEPYRAVPWFWSDQYDVKLQIAGLSTGYDQVVLRGDPQVGRSFCAFYLAAGKLLAVDAINRPREYLAIRKALGAGAEVEPSRLADESIDPRELCLPT